MSFFKNAEDYDQSLSGLIITSNSIRKKCKLSDEGRAKLSATHKGKKLSDETKAKMSAAHKGKTISAEQRAKLSKANIEYKYHCPYGTFDTAKDIEKISGLTPRGIRYRCNSEGFPEWSRSKVKNLTK